jgi:hypothetical protein
MDRKGLDLELGLSDSDSALGPNLSATELNRVTKRSPVTSPLS